MIVVTGLQLWSGELSFGDSGLSHEICHDFDKHKVVLFVISSPLASTTYLLLFLHVTLFCSEVSFVLVSL